MPKFPEPPSVERLASIAPEMLVLPTGTTLARVFFRGGDHPASWDALRHWGPGGGRFDHHLPDGAGRPRLQDRGITYVAGSEAPGGLAVCAAEVFQETRVIDLSDREPWFTSWRTPRPLGLLDLTGVHATRIGASALIASGPKARAQRWSRRLYAAHASIEGIAYRSSMGGGAPVFALFERARDAFPPAPDFHRALADPDLLQPLLKAAARIGYAVDAG